MLADLNSVCSRVSRYVAQHLKPEQGKWNVATQQRISFTNSILSSVKNIKMLGMQQAVADRIRDLRKQEMDAARGVRLLAVQYGASGKLNCFSELEKCTDSLAFSKCTGAFCACFYYCSVRSSCGASWRCDGRRDCIHNGCTSLDDHSYVTSSSYLCLGIFQYSQDKLAELGEALSPFTLYEA